MLEIMDKSLIRSDCLDILIDWYDGGKRNFIDVIYIDPPFNSQRDYNVIISSSDEIEEAFKDTWSRIGYIDLLEIIAKLSPTFYSFLVALDKSAIPKSYITYLCMMGVRCWYMNEMLKDTGCFFYHCDPTASHYIKMMLDTIFGIENFRNEIIWYYKTGGVSKTNFAKKHDIIFFYSKTKDHKFIPQRELKERKAIQLAIEKGEEIFEDEDGKYTWMIRPGRNPDYPDGVKEYIENYVRDVWVDIPAINNMALERKGYPTQKPEKLLERIISATSKRGDIIVDFYLGGGTTTIVAEKLDRKWIGVDRNFRALQIAQERLEEFNRKVKRDFFMYGIGSSKDIREMIDLNILGKDKDSRFDLEDLLFKYCFKDPKVVGNKKKRGDDSIDGRFMFDFGGEKLLGIAQATVSGNKDHLRKSVSHFFGGEGASMLVYITWRDRIKPKLIEEAKRYGKIENIDKVTLMSLEEVIDDGKQITLPSDPEGAKSKIQPNQTF